MQRVLAPSKPKLVPFVGVVVQLPWIACLALSSLVLRATVVLAGMAVVLQVSSPLLFKL